MQEIYNRLLNGSGSRDVIVKDMSVISELSGKMPSVVIKSVYQFKGSTNITKETQNLVQRTTNVVKLTKIEIVRTTNRKNVAIAIRFLNDDDVLIFSESDVNLLTMSDDMLLRKIGVFVV